MARFFFVPLLLLFVVTAFASVDTDFFNSRPKASSGPRRQWAILVAGSKTYANYRHQADICHAYQLLRDRGLREERIVVMMYDDIANNTENPTPGVILNHPEGANVYQGVAKDYTGDLVTPENFLKILQGRKLKRGSGKIIASGRNDNILIFFSGHGGPGLLDFPNGGALKASQLINTITTMRRKQRYHTMVIYIEASRSGSLFDGRLPSNLNVYATTSARPSQNSYSCYWDSYRNVPLGSEYSVKWMEHAEENDLIATSLYSQFRHVRKVTKQSDVMQYGDTNMGKMQVSWFLGSRKPKPILRRKIPCTPSADRDVTITILQNKIQKATEPTAKTSLQEKLVQTMRNRAYMELKVAEIATIISREKKDIAESLLSSKKNAQNIECYEDAVSYFDVKCFSLSDNPYALQHLHVFINACESGYPLKDITDAMDTACIYPSIRGIE
ncbi:hypothetical protein V5799_005731 [Amblyomma americanum]|uniref:legumain n=1 Tax=Amblyomma americanum TaxID=6943 RepID=A0AAQ4DYE8_AMBAM